MVGRDQIAARYARALYDFLKDPKKISGVVDELRLFSSQMENNAELTLSLTSALFSSEQKQKVLEDVLKKLKVSDACRKILLTICQTKRLAYLSAIAEKLHLLLLEVSNVVPVKIEVSGKISDDTMAKIQEKFEHVMGKKVEPTFVVLPEILGGLRATAGGKTFDGSLMTRLDSLREELVGG